MTADVTPVSETNRVWNLGYALYRAALNNTPNGHALYARMSKPVPGDLVIEVTHRGDDHSEAVGWLKDVRMVDRFDPDEPEPREVWQEEQTFIERFDGAGELSWSNCVFVAVPDGVKWPS